MLVVLVVVLGAAIVPLLGGRFSRLVDARLRFGWVIAAALAAQVLFISVVPDVPAAVGRGLHLGTYVLAAVFLVANRHVLGLWVVALGAACNVVAITANGGVMPASRAALDKVGLGGSEGFENSASLDDARFAFLGDIWATPPWFPFANVFSVGDVLIAVGAILTIHTLCGSRLARRPTPRPEMEVMRR